MSLRTLTLVTLLVLPLVATPLGALAQAEETALKEQTTIQKARVLEASKTETVPLSGTSIEIEKQTLTVEVLDGPLQGQEITFLNDYLQLEEGDIFYLRHLFGGFHPETFTVADPYRLDVLFSLLLIFVVLLFLFGGLSGIRGLMSLLGSIALIFYLLIPGIYGGTPPVLISLIVCGLIIIVGSYVTHGFTRTTTLAMFGMLATILVTGVGTHFAINLAQLTGFSTEENVYLNFNVAGGIDMLGLLFAGIMIGLLGVLYDVAIGQAVAVEELVRAGKEYTRSQIFARAMRMGHEHIGAVVNTLAIAYVGASLPLLLLFQASDASIFYIVNSELFATEIIRILMGSIGLLLAVPITTLLATHFLYGKKFKETGKGFHTHLHSHTHH